MPTVPVSLQSSSPSSIPIAPPLHLKHPMVGGAMLTAAGTPLEAFKDLETHRTGFFRKKVTIANMLAWTKVHTVEPLNSGTKYKIQWNLLIMDRHFVLYREFVLSLDVNNVVNIRCFLCAIVSFVLLYAYAFPRSICLSVLFLLSFRHLSS